jgi:hypothetical protein
MRKRTMRRRVRQGRALGLLFYPRSTFFFSTVMMKWQTGMRRVVVTQRVEEQVVSIPILVAAAAHPTYWHLVN